MTRYHLNPNTGDPGECTATISCPFAAKEHHYSSPEKARSAYEKAQTEMATDLKVLSKAEKKEAKFREELEPLIGVASAKLARYRASGQKGFTEDSVAAAYLLQKHVFAKTPGSEERRAAVASRDEGLRQLLAADIAFHRGDDGIRSEDDAIEAEMVRNARNVLAAHDGLEAALADQEGQAAYAANVRVPVEDVEYVLRRALKEYNEPRGRQDSLNELSENRTFTAGTARQIRVQPEDVTRILGLALGYTPKH